MNPTDAYRKQGAMLGLSKSFERNSSIMKGSADVAAFLHDSS